MLVQLLGCMLRFLRPPRVEWLFSVSCVLLQALADALEDFHTLLSPERWKDLGCEPWPAGGRGPLDCLSARVSALACAHGRRALLFPFPPPLLCFQGVFLFVTSRGAESLRLCTLSDELRVSSGLEILEGGLLAAAKGNC